MVPYNQHRAPDLNILKGALRGQQTNGVSSMHASIHLDQPHSTYTNLDFISGRVIVSTSNSAKVSTIVVKLEGESRTRLMPPVTPQNDRPRPVLEFHKILYRVQMVFPPVEVMNERAAMPGQTTFTLPPGQHEYPFRFKIPFNNSCDTAKNSNPAINFAGLSMEMSRAPAQHVKKALPPTLTGFPGEADIRYYVKATVSRPNFLKENARAYLPFNFCPIEPIRGPPTGEETFARRKHEFITVNDMDAKGKGKKSMFARMSAQTEKGGDGSQSGKQAPFISVDVRLPQPPVLTCNKPIPFRLIFASQNGQKEHLSIQSLQIDLVAYTHVRAHDVVRTETTGTTMISKSNIGIPVPFVNGNEATIDNRLWQSLAIPNTIPPSFETCNISRRYELVTRVGVKYEPARIQPQYTTMELRHPVQLYSGIAPSPELIEAMTKPPSANGRAEPALPARRPEKSGSVPYAPPTPAEPSAATSHPPNGTPHDAPPMYSEAPPSYEDAVADQLPPVNSGEARPEYAPPAAGEDYLLPSDEKKGWH